jgi:hypothetical protein
MAKKTQNHTPDFGWGHLALAAAGGLALGAGGLYLAARSRAQSEIDLAAKSAVDSFTRGQALRRESEAATGAEDKQSLAARAEFEFGIARDSVAEISTVRRLVPGSDYGLISASATTPGSLTIADLSAYLAARRLT